MSNQQAKHIAYLLGRLQRAEGGLGVTQLAVRALILQSNDLQAAIDAVSAQIEGAIAAGLPRDVDEEFLDRGSWAQILPGAPVPSSG